MCLSVCMATYNGAKFLPQQVGSILAQLGPADELVVVDDASTDSTVAILSALQDPRIEVIANERNLGLIATFERALRHAGGDVVFLSDQDDVWLPGKVAAMTAALREADLVVSDCRVVDESLNELAPSFFALRRSGPGLTRNLLRNSYLGCCLALRRDLLEVALPFPPSLPMHDWWLGLIGESFGRVAFVAEPLLLYRRHGRNASTTAQRSTAGWMTRLRWRARIGLALLSRRLQSGPRKPPLGTGGPER